MLVFPLLLLDETLCSRLPAGCAGGGAHLQWGAVKVSSLKKRFMEVWMG